MCAGRGLSTSAVRRQDAIIGPEDIRGLQMVLRGGGGGDSADADEATGTNFKMDPKIESERILDQIEDLLREGNLARDIRDASVHRDKEDDQSDEGASDVEKAQEEEVGWSDCGGLTSHLNVLELTSPLCGLIQVFRMSQYGQELSKEIEADFVQYAKHMQERNREEGHAASNASECVDLRAAVAKWMRAEAEGGLCVSPAAPTACSRASAS
jgi:hypothetical protein